MYTTPVNGEREGCFDCLFLSPVSRVHSIHFVTKEVQTITKLTTLSITMDIRQGQHSGQLQVVGEVVQTDEPRPSPAMADFAFDGLSILACYCFNAEL